MPEQLDQVLVVANRTAATPALLEAVRERARHGGAQFHLVVPASPGGLHRVVDPEDHGREAAVANLEAALPLLSEAAGSDVTGHVGDPNPVSAVHDAVHGGNYDEIIISTLRSRISGWVRFDLLSKARGLGLPLTHVEPDGVDACLVGDEPAPPMAMTG
ncbi:MAG: hypothetical protein ABIZ50_02280 [Solirubrobacterales bacterium]